MHSNKAFLYKTRVGRTVGISLRGDSACSLCKSEIADPVYEYVVVSVNEINFLDRLGGEC